MVIPLIVRESPQTEQSGLRLVFKKMQCSMYELKDCLILWQLYILQDRTRWRSLLTLFIYFEKDSINQCCWKTPTWETGTYKLNVNQIMNFILEQASNLRDAICSKAKFFYLQALLFEGINRVQYTLSLEQSSCDYYDLQSLLEFW